MDREKMTPARLKALRWIAENEPVQLFKVGGDCSMVMAKRLRDAGYVEEQRAPSRFSFIRWSLTHKGRVAIKVNAP